MLELPSVISSLIFGCSLLELLCLRTFLFTVTLANVLLAFASVISSDEILVFVTCFYFGKT